MKSTSPKPGELKLVKTVSIGIFAHNEAENILAILKNLNAQNIFKNPEFSVKVYLLANGCSDRTVCIATEFLSNKQHSYDLNVIEIERGGKSRTWNFFVHSLVQDESGYVIFMDADIILDDPSTLDNLATFIERRSDIIGSSSLPRKNVATEKKPSFIQKMIAAGGGTSGHNLKTAICGQLYILRATAAKRLCLPIHLPVEDGFVRHAIITSNFSESVNESVIDQCSNVSHLYESEKTLAGLIRHQVRIVIGSAINAALFAMLIDLRKKSGPAAVSETLKLASTDDEWLRTFLKTALPTPKYGWVPLPWLYSRTRAFVLRGPYAPKRIFVAVMGLGLDLVVYVMAQYKMARGVGAGFW